MENKESLELKKLNEKVKQYERAMAEAIKWCNCDEPILAKNVLDKAIRNK